MRKIRCSDAQIIGMIKEQEAGMAGLVTAGDESKSLPAPVADIAETGTATAVIPR